MVKYNRDEEDVSQCLDRLRLSTPIPKPKLCKVVFRTEVNMDFLVEVHDRTTWRVVLIGEKEILLKCIGEFQPSLMELIAISRDYHNCCRMMKLN